MSSRPSRTLASLALLGAVMAGPLAARQESPADLILHAGRVWTGDEARPWAEAVAVRGDVVVRVGADAQVLALRGDGTRLIDLRGRFLSPGFIDNHTHFNRKAT